MLPVDTIIESHHSYSAEVLSRLVCLYDYDSISIPYLWDEQEHDPHIRVKTYAVEVQGDQLVLIS